MAEADVKVGVDEGVGGGSGAGQASGGALSQAVTQALQALTQNQATMQSGFEKLLSSLNENITKLASTSISEDTAKKQDTNVDEQQAAASGVLTSDQLALSRIVNSQAAFHADARAHSLHRHVETMQTILGMYLGGTQFAQNVCQNMLVADVHQQCARNADWRSSTVASKHENQDVE